MIEVSVRKDGVKVNAAAEDAIRNIDPGLRYFARQNFIGGVISPERSKSVNQVIKTFRNQAKDVLNLCNTTMLYKARDSYKGLVRDIAREAHEIMNSAATGVISGVESYLDRQSFWCAS